MAVERAETRLVDASFHCSGQASRCAESLAGIGLQLSGAEQRTDVSCYHSIHASSITFGTVVDGWAEAGIKEIRSSYLSSH